MVFSSRHFDKVRITAEQSAVQSTLMSWPVLGMLAVSQTSTLYLLYFTFKCCASIPAVSPMNFFLLLSAVFISPGANTKLGGELVSEDDTAVLPQYCGAPVFFGQLYQLQTELCPQVIITLCVHPQQKGKQVEFVVQITLHAAHTALTFPPF